MNPTPSTPATVPPPRRRRRWLRYALVFLVMLVGLLSLLYVYMKWSSELEAASVLAETDRLDPRWRLEDIEADRETLKSEENSAELIGQVVALSRGGGNFTARPGFYEQFEKLEPQHELNATQMELLREAYAEMQEAVALARTLKDMPRGRFSITYADDFISTLLPKQQEARRTFEILQHDVMFRAQTGDLDGAVDSCRAGLNAGRSLGDEPFLISFLIRCAGDAIALAALERSLAQGRPTEKSLAPMQALLEREVDDLNKHWVNALRGERGGLQRLMQAISNGKLRMSQLTGGFPGNGPNFGDRLADLAPVFLTRGHPNLLRHMNDAVANGQLPLEQQHDKMLELQKQHHQKSMLVRLLAPALQKVTIAHLRTQASLRAASIAIAAERYRLKHERWPATLTELTQSGLLSKVPTDPHDGAPMRWKSWQDGQMAYSVGLDKHDDGGKLATNHNPIEPGFDWGFKLWNLARRRQAPQPPVAIDDAQGR